MSCLVKHFGVSIIHRTVAACFEYLRLCLTCSGTNFLTSLATFMRETSQSNKSGRQVRYSTVVALD